VELTATPRTGFHRYTFQEKGEFHILINLDEVLYRGDPAKSKVNEAYFDIKNDSTIRGYLRCYVKQVDRQVYFTIRLNKPFSGHHFLDGSEDRKLILDYNMGQNEQLELRVALSTVSIDGAKNNLQAESIGIPFEKIRENAV